MKMICKKTIAELTYEDVIAVLKELLDDGWEIVDEPRKPVLFRDPNGVTMDIMRALHIYFLDEDIGKRNAHTMMVEEHGFNNTLFTIFSYASEHREHGRYYELMRALDREPLAA